MDTFICPLCSCEHPEGTTYCEAMLSEIPRGALNANGGQGPQDGPSGSNQDSAAGESGEDARGPMGLQGVVLGIREIDQQIEDAYHGDEAAQAWLARLASSHALAGYSAASGEEWAERADGLLRKWGRQAEAACGSLPREFAERGRQTYLLSGFELVAEAVRMARCQTAGMPDMALQAMQIASAVSPVRRCAEPIVALLEKAQPDDLGIIAICRGLLADEYNASTQPEGRQAHRACAHEPM